MDFEMFKKALVRIAIMAQNALGGHREDLLIGLLDNETKKNKAEKVKT